MKQPTNFVVLLGGVAGAGKTTQGEALARTRNMEFIDGDKLHPAANKAKMARGQPLTDQDRWPWLIIVRNEIVRLATSGPPGVVACSALKEAYRECLCEAPPRVLLLFLTVPYQTAYERIRQREGDFFHESLLKSQYDALEVPPEDSCIDASKPVADVLADVETAIDRT